MTPEGSAPVSENAKVAGSPVATTLNVPGVPTLKATVLALVIAGAWFTLSVKLCVAAGATPFAALIVIG